MEKKALSNPFENQAFDLLVEIVMRGRDGLPYDDLLPQLRVVLDKAPRIQEVIRKIVINRV